MKLALLGLALFGCALAEPPVPQGGLLVLPSGPVYTPPAPYRQQSENLEQVNEKVMQRLQQERGSQRGNYHVYLPDGRLQKVTYAAAPVRQQQQQQPGYQNSYTTFQKQQTEEEKKPTESGYNYEKPSSTFVEFQRQEVQKLPAGSPSYSRVSYQGASSSANLQTAAEPDQVIAHFSRLQNDRVYQQLEQLKRQQEALKQKEHEIVEQLQELKDFTKSYVATLRVTEVPPIPAPIYSPSPAPLTRIVRYAPVFY